MKGNRQFWHSLHGRGLHVVDLAERIFSCRCQVTKVLNGSLKGPQTRKRLLKAAVLTEREVQLLGWEVPHGTKFAVEHSEDCAAV